jgi:hypothetical protein
VLRAKSKITQDVAYDQQPDRDGVNQMGVAGNKDEDDRGNTKENPQSKQQAVELIR